MGESESWQMRKASYLRLNDGEEKRANGRLDWVFQRPGFVHLMCRVQHTACMLDRPSKASLGAHELGLRVLF